MKPRILITGAGGQLGRSFVFLREQFPELDLIPLGSGDMDIASKEAVVSGFDAHDPAVCINCAAYTAVDKAESEPEIAHLINALGTKFLAEACAEKSIPLIHFSTDYVYHGTQNTPFLEEDAVNPQSVYANTKLEGENLALKAHPNTAIIRTSWVYAPWGKNFVNTMLRLGRERDALNVVFDQIGSPTYAPDLARAVLNIISNKENLDKLGGVWHYSNEGVASWYDFARAIFDLEGIDCKLSPILTSEYPTPAMRPPFSLLNKSKIKRTFGVEIPYWRTSLAACLRLLREESL